jgi:hypothetical protein
MQCECAILSPVACTALQYFPTLSNKRHHFFKKMFVYRYKVCVFSLQRLSETFLILRIQQGIIKMYIVLHVKHRLLLSDINLTLIFSTDFRKLHKRQTL